MRLAVGALAALFVWPSGAVAAQSNAVAMAASVPPSTRADLDSTTPPCQDFYQYANGGWYQRQERENNTSRLQVGLLDAEGFGARLFAHDALQQFLARTPALAAITADPALRVVGYFYDSCLADASGMAEGTVGDSARSSYCFRTTRRYLDRAVFELFMEHVWPPAARAESRQFWARMQAAALERFRTSTALSDSTKQRMLALVARQRLTTRMEGMDTSARVTWPADPVRPRGVRGPSIMPFAGAEIATTWIYRDYRDLVLSPTDFQGNVARLEAAPDTVPLPALPGGRDEEVRFMDGLLGRSTWMWLGGDPVGPSMPFQFFILPLVDGKIDLGVWYGMVGAAVGHEATHAWHDELSAVASQAELTAFAQEQFHGQLVSYGHPFNDVFGMLVAHDAFQRARQDWPQAKIDGFTPEQRFFLGAAWSWRGRTMGLNPETHHTRYRIAANGALSALPTFKQAFACQAGAPMAGGRVWYAAPWSGLVLRAADRDALAHTYEQALEFSVGVKNLGLTTEQQAAFTARRRTHDAHRQALLGEPGKPGRVADPAELYRLMGQELGELRAVLTPEQQARFDPEARGWMADPVTFRQPPRGRSGGGYSNGILAPVFALRYDVEIPGVEWERKAQ